MTSRRGTLVEDGARELLQLHGYTVRVIPPGFNKKYPPAHLVAERDSGETRFLRIRKISHRPPTEETVKLNCWPDIVQFRKYLSRHMRETGLRCEIWLYTLRHGFRCFEVLMEGIREIPKLPPARQAVSRGGGTA